MASRYKQSKHISPRCSRIPNNVHFAFTIVELLVVIVVIAILAAITIVSYTNITAQANASSVKSTLSQAIKGLEDYKITDSTNETYPSSSVFSSLNIANDSNNISYTYYPSDTSTTPSSYCLEGTTNNTTFSISSTDEAVLNKPCTENSLVGWWKLNGDATDSSGNGNDGTVVGAVAATGEDGTASHAMSFDGTGDYIDLPLTFKQSNVYSVSIWVNETQAPPSGQYYRFIGTNSWNPGRWGIISVPLNMASANSYFGSGYDYWLNSSKYITLGVWNNIVVVFNRKGHETIYFNGVYASSADMSSAISNDWLSSNIRISCGDDAGSSYSYLKFIGSMDDARIYNRALSADEVLEIYEDGAQ